jgi:hypothetical protein
VTEQTDHDCTNTENLKSPSALQAVDAEEIIQTFTCSVCGDKVVEIFKLDSREVAEE